MLANERGVMAALQRTLMIHYSKERIPAERGKGDEGRERQYAIRADNSIQEKTTESLLGKQEVMWRKSQEEALTYYHCLMNPLAVGTVRSSGSLYCKHKHLLFTAQG